MKRRTLAILLALTLWLPGCGPGTGGTGSGNELGLADFGAKAAPVCGASFSSSLACSPPTQTTTVSPGDPLPVPSAAGTETRRFVDSLQVYRVMAQFDGNTVSLDARCQHLTFHGEWGVTALGEARFFGSYLPDGGARRTAGSIDVQVVGAALQITLRDAAGQLLLGPVALVQAPAALPPFGDCGS